MRLGSALECVASVPTPEKFSQFCSEVDAQWIEEALAATGTATIRRRRLPAQQVVWLVIGMAMFRDCPISEVVTTLGLAEPSQQGAAVVPSAVAQARARLGESPLAWLFARCSDQWAHSSADRDRWRGLALYGVDGTTFQVPDTQENRDHFGLASSGNRGLSGYPLVRLTALMAVRSHLLAGASFGPYGRSEHWYAQDLWPCLPDDSLVIVDRYFWSAKLLLSVQSQGSNRHWLTRARKGFQSRRLARLGPKDELVQCTVSSEARRQDPSLPETFEARVITYQRKGFRPQRLITSLLDSKQYPAQELVGIYHERWECELAYDEIKTEMMDSIPLRSKSVDGVRQEIWGILMAYNLIRLEMERAAEEASVAPTRISFAAVYRMICVEWICCANLPPSAIARRLYHLRENLKSFVLPPRRSERSYPRAVKVKMSNYAKKQRSSAQPSQSSKPAK